MTRYLEGERRMSSAVQAECRDCECGLPRDQCGVRCRYYFLHKEGLVPHVTFILSYDHIEKFHQPIATEKRTVSYIMLCCAAHFRGLRCLLRVLYPSGRWGRI